MPKINAPQNPTLPVNIEIPGIGQVSTQPDTSLYNPEIDKQALMGMGESDIAKLLQSGYLSPQAAQELSAAKQMKAQEFSAPFSPMAADITDVATGMFTPRATPQMSRPDPAIKEAAAQGARADQAIAEGVQQAQQEAQQRQAARQMKADEDAEIRVAQMDKDVLDSADEKTEDRAYSVRQAIAIMLGAVGQGMTGSKTNAAIEAIDKMIEQEARDKKFNEEKKLALRKQVLDEAQFELAKQREKSESALRRAQIDAMQAKIAGDMQELGAAQNLKARIASGQDFTPQEVSLLGGKDGEDLRGRMVEYKPGRMLPAVTVERAKKVSEDLTTLRNAQQSANKMKELIEYFGNNPAKKIFSRAEVAQAAEAAQGLVGGLRLPYFGPGVLTDNEQKIAKGMFGNPTDLLSLASANRAAIDSVLKKLKYAEKNALSVAGVPMRPSRFDLMLKKMSQENPKVPQYKIWDALISQGYSPDED